ncbi:MAG: UDP-glucose dehydrogenase family protein [Planctomycetota bacterium]
MRIAVVGTGYVGLVTGTCFADTGHQVSCVDKDRAKIDALLRGEVPIYEPGLEHLIQRNVSEGRLVFTTELAPAVGDAEIVFIAVGTPQSHDGQADLTAVREVARQIGRAVRGFAIIVNKSTVPVGTAKIVTEIIAAETSHPFEVVSNPEFLKEGAAIDDFTKPDRVVVGTSSQRAAEVMRELYAPFLRTGKPLLVMDTASAEMTKYASNALLATRISFMNEIAGLCTAVGADVSQVRSGVGADSRLGYSFLFPGVGYGGSCFPKDVRAISALAREHDLELRIMAAVDQVNELQKEVLANKVIARFGRDLRGHTFGMWGLAFKPETDDMREAPSITIADVLLKHGAKVRGYDPEARRVASQVFGGRIEIVDKPYAALDGASALLLVTEWNEFRRPDFAKIRSLLKTPVVFDGRNIYTAKTLLESGFEYFGIGVRDSSYE